MKRVILISCVSKKLSEKATARDLYISPLFRMNLAYAESLNPDLIFILSAKYGLTPLDQVIEPYNLTLNTMPVGERRAWGEKVLAQLLVHIHHSDEVIFLAGKRYREFIMPHFNNVKVPMEGLGIGRQLAFLKKALYAKPL